MDEVAKYNKERWEELAKANVMFSRPWLDLNRKTAREMIDPHGMIDEIAGKDVLCLAGGGGQQSAAFALLGAKVTVLDFSETQLKRDKQAASHYKVSITTVQGDMRDLSAFEKDVFDIVYHVHSIVFIPEIDSVFQEVARVLRTDGLYHLHCHNPSTQGIDEEDWNGHGYSLHLPYVDGAEIIPRDPYWEIHSEDGAKKQVRGPREFRHTLSGILNGLIRQRFVILGLWEETGDESDAKPGTWEHFESIAAPFLTFWAAYRPYVFTMIN